MSKINLLDAEVYDLIAAGEVVERPASVVKELVENSIDAGAKKIKVEIVGGGVRLIRVTDNGCGMSPEDARKAFLKHATSKISDKQDLFNIHTLGFRGEALASISAVSKVKLLTKEHGSDCGTCIVVEGGRIVSEGDAGCAEGTSFEIRDLFYNTPARLKFLKSDMTEVGHITFFIEKLALSRADISFSYSVNGVQRLFTPGNGNAYEALFSVYGKEFCDNMMKVSYDDGKVAVEGFAGKPLASRPNRNFQVFFVNGRVVRSKALQTAFEAVYHTSMMVGRYPCGVLMLTVDPTNVDINVHPSKLEIKFAEEKAVCDSFYQAVKDALNRDSAIANVEFEKARSSMILHQTPAPMGNSRSVGSPRLSEKIQTPVRLSEPVVPVPEKKIREVKTYGDWTIIDYKNPKPQKEAKTAVVRPTNIVSSEMDKRTEDVFKPVDVAIPEPGITASDKPVAAELRKRDENPVTSVNNQETSLTNKVSAVPDYRIAGEVFNTYIIIEIFSDSGNEMLFIDKHALHERMIFEELRTKTVGVQTLLVPQLCNIGAVETSLLLENRDELEKAGFDIEDFGGQILVRSIPALIAPEDVEAVLSEYFSMKKSRNGNTDEVFDRFLYSLACKAAIKSGYVTSDIERKALVEKFFVNREKLKYCPHGRPITFSLTEKALEKQFKRIV